MNKRHSLAIAIFLTLLWPAIGTAGYSIIEGWNFLDSLFMTIITLTTVGYSEVNGLSDTGRVFTILLLISGVVTIAFCMRVLVEYMIDEKWAEQIRRRRVEKQLAKLNGHVVICGYGKIGSHISREMKISGREFVVIALAQPDEPDFDNVNSFFIDGDATEEENLVRAGIERAEVLIAAVRGDADNLFITMTARGMNPNLRIVARTADKANENKFRRAGANSVICPYELGGRRIATSVLRPNVTEFLDTVMSSGGVELRLEEVALNSAAPFIGKSLLDSRIRNECGTIVLAIRKGGGVLTMNPDPSITLDSGDVMVVLGTNGQIDSLHKLNRNGRG